MRTRSCIARSQASVRYPAGYSADEYRMERACRLGRFAQLVAVGGQSPDHPVFQAIDETRYLRAFLFPVTDA